MSLNRTAVLGTVLSIGLIFAIPAGPAAARTAGKESFRGQIIAPARSGTRHVVSSIVVAEGVFAGFGKIVEVANRPRDPGNVSRDNLVFARGTIHIRNTSRAPHVSVNAQTCAIKVTIKQTTKVQGGTGKFRHASGTFTGTAHSWGVAARTPDGSCNMHADVLLDADAVSGQGTLSF
jgi:hypothetical protein